jgi:hypothetical protein
MATASASLADLNDRVGSLPQFGDSQAIRRCRRSARGSGQPKPGGNQHRHSITPHFDLLSKTILGIGADSEFHERALLAVPKTKSAPAQAGADSRSRAKTPT